jgi:anti-sigma B factor antagonist
VTGEPWSGGTPARFAVSLERPAQQRPVVGLIGELDMGTTPTLRKILEMVPGPVVLDCTNLEFIDSSGLAAIVAAHKQRHGDLTLRNLRPFARELLEITGLAPLLGVDQGRGRSVS